MDLGTDAGIGAMFATEHKAVMDFIVQDSLQQKKALSKCQILQLSLSKLRNRMCTPHALSVSGIPMRQLAQRYGLRELVEWGFTFRHMLIAGLTRDDLGSFTYDICAQMHLQANDMLELRPRPAHVAAMQLSDTQFIELGMNNITFLQAAQYNYANMREHPFSLQQWSHILQDKKEHWKTLGFVDFDACSEVWDADELFKYVFGTPAATAPHVFQRTTARLNLLDIG